MLQYKSCGGGYEITSVITEQFLVNKPLLYNCTAGSGCPFSADSLGRASEDSLIRRDSSPEVVLGSELRNVGWIAPEHVLLLLPAVFICLSMST